MSRSFKRFAVVLAAVSLFAVYGCSSKPAEQASAPQEVIDIEPDDPEATAPSLAVSPSPSGTHVLPTESAVPGEPTPTPDDSDLTGVADPEETPLPERTYEEWKALNDEVVGWVKIKDTKINYPVVLGSDNDYYLRNNAEKKSSKSGAVFMDYRNANKDEQRHLIVYGHNMRNGTMFHDLNNYKLEEFFNAHDTIQFTFNGKEGTWKVFSAYIANTGDTYFVHTKFASDDEFVSYMKELKDLSQYKTDVSVGADDQVLTLVTCTYEYDNARYVVHAKKV